MSTLELSQVAVVGLGYVGLPLAVEFGRLRPTVGFDIDDRRVSQLTDGVDRTRETSVDDLRAATHLRFTSDPHDLSESVFFIVTVPTPIDAAKRPDLRPIVSASEAVGCVMRPGSTVVYESTVYPGATEEVAVPILEAHSGLKFNRDFFVGYSPERINPGDRTHRLPTITKVTSGSTPATAASVDDLYRQIITAGTHRAPSIRVAEAAKVIENTQRDLNIALVNELSVLFTELGIDTHDVLEAAGTKWNFLGFRPGLVGGHCIGVDPYYLTHKAQEVGHYPDVILAGRRINDSMGSYVADQLILLMARRGIHVGQSRVLVLGLAFKEDCPDHRNTKVVDVVERLRAYGLRVDVSDPWVDPAEAELEYGYRLVAMDPDCAIVRDYEAVVLAVAHSEFVPLGEKVRSMLDSDVGNGVIFDVKGVWPRDLVDGRL